MIVTPVNPNAIEIPIVQTGCLKSEFDSTYPIHLNGIIRQDEFQQSIENINRTISSRKPLIICGLIFIICIIGGITLFIVGGLVSVNSRTRGFPVLVGAGLGLFVLGMIVLSIGCFIIQSQRATRMQRAIANESMKYSTRSPTPCSWRLHSSRIWAGRYGRRRTAIIYRLVIEVGHSVAPGSGTVSYQYNQTAAQSTAFSVEQNNMDLPPPYYSQSATRFCSRCGTTRQDHTAKFCSSCGQLFNI